MSPDYDNGYETRGRRAEQESGRRLLGILAAVCFVFLILKLTHAIDWSYWWVFAPLWIPFALGFLIALGKAADK